MAETLVFRTPGLLDVRAITIMGVHAKPNSTNPIGYFGTGLKYAIAGLVRLGGNPTIWIGRTKLTFNKTESTFRGKPLQTITMRVNHINGAILTYELPFTIHYGENWEPWQLFRELESNTRDEQGRTSVLALPSGNIEPLDDETFFLTDLPAMIEAATHMNDVFLANGNREGKGILEVLEGPSKYLYYRTLRVYEPSKPTIFTYNFFESMELTEDRTLKWEFMARSALARWVVSDATEEQIKAITQAKEGDWEYRLDYPAHIKPSAAFVKVMAQRLPRTSGSAKQYYFGGSSHSGWAPRSEQPKLFDLLEEHPAPWTLTSDNIVVDNVKDEIFQMPTGYDAKAWKQVAKSIIARCTSKSTEETPF